MKVVIRNKWPTSVTVHSWAAGPGSWSCGPPWSKFKAALALKGPDGVLCVLPSGSLIFVLWTSVLSTAPHPAALPGSEFALAKHNLLLAVNWNISNLWWVMNGNTRFFHHYISLCLLYSGNVPLFYVFIQTYS